MTADDHVKTVENTANWTCGLTLNAVCVLGCCYKAFYPVKELSVVLTIFVLQLFLDAVNNTVIVVKAATDGLDPS